MNLHLLKTSYLLIAIIGISMSLQAQIQVTHKGGWFYIEGPGINVTPGVIKEDLYINGSLEGLPGNTFPVVNLGNIHITGDVIGNGSNQVFGNIANGQIPDSTANIYLIGSVEQQLRGDSIINFSNLIVQNSFDTVSLQQNIHINTSLQLVNGNINLNGDTIKLGSSGRLVGEDNNKRIFGPFGYVELTKLLSSGNTYSNISGTGIDLTVNGNLGLATSIYRGHVSQASAANNSIERFYQFKPTNPGAVSNPKIHYLDQRELFGNNEDSLNLYLSETYGLNWEDKQGVRNTTTDEVDAIGLNWVLNNQSIITLAEDSCDNPPPLAFSYDTVALCNGANAWLAPVGIIGNKSKWNTGIQNFDSIQVSAAGNYFVEITDVYGCINSDSVVVIAAPSPVVNFTATPVCENSSTVFNNQTTIVGNTPITYAWEMGDTYTPVLDTTSVENPQFTYTTQGTFNVQLQAVSKYNCVTNLTKSIVVLPYPIVAFTIADSCADSTLAIINNTTVSPSAGITYNWNFGGLSSSTQQQPVVSLNQTGIHTVSLIATSNGCSTTETAPLTIHPNPAASFTAAAVCLNQTSSLVNTSTITSGTNSYSWTLDIGINSVLENPTYIYPTSGNHIVDLLVISDNGCRDSYSNSIVVNSLPIPSFTANNTCTDEVMNFTNTSNNLSDTFSWLFEGGNGSNSIHPTYLFNTEGIHRVKLSATSSLGCIDSISIDAVSLPVPLANFTTLNNCQEDTLQFQNSSSISTGLMTYQWDFNDGSLSILTSPEHSYLSSGTYNVELIVESNEGCNDTISQAIIVDPMPVVNLGGQITTCGTSYLIDAQNTGDTYLWSDNSTNQSLTALFNGTYFVAVTNVAGCTSKDTVQVTLNSVVQPQLGLDAQFCDIEELDAGYPLSTYLWSDGSSNQTLNITSSGSYWVQVTDQNGCLGRDTIVAAVVTSIQPNLGADVDLCDGESVTLNPNGAGTYFWSDNSTLGTLNTSVTGTYWVELVDANNCINRDTLIVTVSPNPIVNLGADGNYCDHLELDITTLNASYLWNDNSILSTQNLTSNGLYWGEATDLTTGCTTRDSINVNVISSPQINLGNDTLICYNNTVLLDAQNTGATYNWNIGDLTQTLLIASTGVYSVNVTANGCTTNDSISIVVNGFIDSDLGDDYTLCRGTSTILSTPTNTGISQWYFNNNIISQNVGMINVDAPGTYSVVVTDVNNCSARDTIELITTQNELVADFLAKSEVIIGDTIQFVNTSYPSPFESYWSFDDGAFSNAEDPEHAYFVPDIYNVKLVVTSNACSDTVVNRITVLLTKSAKFQSEFTDLYNEIESTLLYPNPTKGQFTLKVELRKEDNLELRFYNMVGELIAQENTQVKSFEKQYDFSELRAGMYFIQLKVGTQFKTIKFIKI